MITPENIVRHELIGLKVKIYDSTDKGIIGVTGLIVDETRNMFIVNVGSEEKKIVKDQCVFSFFLPDIKKWVKVIGSILVARPEDRIKKKIKKW